VIIRTSALNVSEYCLGHNVDLGRESGLTDEQLRALPRWRESDAFSPVERLVLEYAEGITRTPADVPDRLVEDLRSELDERQLVELTAAIALENFRARFNLALGVEAAGFSEGAFCVLPDRAGASA
jgi:alkylhydroperoxidase family enzyme